MERVYTAFLFGPADPLYFCTGNGFVDFNGAYYEPRIIQPGLLRSEIRIDGIFNGGSASSSIGEIVLANADGALDYMRGLAFDGTTALLNIYDDETGLPVAGDVTIGATIKTVKYDWKTVTIVIQDKSEELSAKPFHIVRYLGNNVLPNGTEGTAADVQDIVKPILLGNKTNLPAVIVNTSKLIYQVSMDVIGGGTVGITAVYVGGSPWTNAGLASPNINDAATPAAGTFISDTAGRFRLGSAPPLRVTCNAQVTLGAGDIIKRIAAQGYSIGLVSSSDVTAANTAYSSAVSPYFFSNEEKTVGEALNEFCSGFGYYWYIEQSTSIFRFFKISEPTGLPVISLDVSNIIDIDIEDTGAVPIKQVTCRYDKNLAIMERNELAGGLSEATIQSFGLDYKKRTTSTSSTHLTAGEYVFDANTGASGTALDLASERLSLQSVDRLTIRVTVNTQQYAAPTLWSVVKVTLDRFSLAAGKLFRVIATEHDRRRNQLELKLWG